MQKKNPRFIIVFLVTLVLLTLLIFLVDKYLGGAIATFLGAIAVAIIMKQFEKLDLNTTFSFANSNKILSQLLPFVISTLIILGCVHLTKGIIQYGQIFFGQDFYCTICLGPLNSRTRLQIYFCNYVCEKD